MTEVRGTGPSGEDRHWSDEVASPVLLRAALRCYGSAVREALAEAGFDDLPRNGAYVVGGMARDGGRLGDGTGSPATELGRQLAVSKQTASQLVDTLVMRGYLERASDPDDRRRMTISLTARGEATAQVISAAGDAMDERVATEIGADELAATRRALGRIVDLGWARHRESPAH